MQTGLATQLGQHAKLHQPLPLELSMFRADSRKCKFDAYHLHKKLYLLLLHKFCVYQIKNIEKSGIPSKGTEWKYWKIWHTFIRYKVKILKNLAYLQKVQSENIEKYGIPSKGTEWKYWKIWHTFIRYRVKILKNLAYLHKVQSANSMTSTIFEVFNHIVNSNIKWWSNYVMPAIHKTYVEWDYDGICSIYMVYVVLFIYLFLFIIDRFIRQEPNYVCPCLHNTVLGSGHQLCVTIQHCHEGAVHFYIVPDSVFDVCQV